MILFHITTRHAWNTALATGVYHPASLETEGFVHLSEEAQWPGALERFFRGHSGLVLLRIDSTRLRATLKYETADGDLFPHLHGELNLDAVLTVEDLPDC